MTRWQDAHGPTWSGLRELHLFAGAGGGILGGLLLGHVPVCAVEIDPYCQEVIRARQRNGMLPEFPVHDDIRTFDGTPWSGRVDVVAGGFPCQDISVAGKGAGIDGERSGLWREMARVIGEVRPRYVFVENSPALVGRGLAVVLGDLAALGYDARWTVLGAHHVGAPHKRDRLWILADAYRGGCYTTGVCGTVGAMEDEGPNDGSTLAESGALADASSEPRESGARRLTGEGQGMAGGRQAPWSDVADAKGRGVEKQRVPAEGGAVVGNALRGRWCGKDSVVADADPFRWDGRAGQLRPSGRAESADSGSVPIPRRSGLAQREGAHGERALAAATRGRRWPAEPRLGRVAHGVADRVDRLRAIGNGQVPRVAAAAWRELMSWEVPT